MNEFPTWAWLVFAGAVATLVAIDILSHRREQPSKHALAWSLFWIGVGLGFGVFVWGRFGRISGQEYFATYLIENSLSVDNLFVFVMIFDALGIPVERRRRALIWGILGAVVSRTLLIFAGIGLLAHFGWVRWVFAGVLVIAAWHMLRQGPSGERKSRLIEFLSRHLPVTQRAHGGRFFATSQEKLVATPLFVAVLAIELSDVVFALDSVPAALSVTTNGFVVLTSNVFAVLGLRAMYAVLITPLRRLRYLSYGLAAILSFAAVKLVLPRSLELPPWASIGAIVLCLMLTVAASLWVHDHRAPAA